MKNYQEIVAPLSEEDKIGLSHHMKLIMLGCYICDDTKEAYDILIGVEDGSQAASDYVTIWEPLVRYDYTVDDLLSLIE